MAEPEANWKCRNAPTCCQGTFSALGDASRELGPHQPTQTVPHEAHFSQPFPRTGSQSPASASVAPGLKRVQVLSGPAAAPLPPQLPSVPLLLTRRGCPDVLGTWHSSIWCREGFLHQPPAACARGAADVVSHLPEGNATSDVGEPAGPDARPLHGGPIGTNVKNPSSWAPGRETTGAVAGWGGEGPSLATSRGKSALQEMLLQRRRPQRLSAISLQTVTF